MDAPDDPLEVLASLRGQRYLVALIGNWHSGAPVLAWDPLELLDADQDPFARIPASRHRDLPRCRLTAWPSMTRSCSGGTGSGGSSS